MLAEATQPPTPLSPLLQGDSGGPLMCQARNANYFWLVGVNSWGKDCAKTRQPSVYTSTQPFYHWILVQTGLVQTERAMPASQRWAPARAIAAPVRMPSQAPQPLGSLLLQKLVELLTWLKGFLQVLTGNQTSAVG